MVRNKRNIFSIFLIVLLFTSSCSDATAKANIKFECPKIETSTTNLKSTGNLIFHKLSGGIYQMNMTTMVMTQINKPNEAVQEFTVSPNRKWIAYIESEFNQP